jgi:uncharacterized membrane protein YeaQ/YmgE (transglycosylase-associated protein family)
MHLSNETLIAIIVVGIVAGWLEHRTVRLNRRGFRRG